MLSMIWTMMSSTMLGVMSRRMMKMGMKEMHTLEEENMKEQR